MEQTQKLKKYDFEQAFKSGYSKSQIVNSLRNDYDTNLDWEKINEDLKELKPKERDEALFDSLYNNQEIWGISGIKIKEQPKGLQNRILSDNQIQDIEKEVQNMPQWAIESALKPQILRDGIGIDGFWKMFQNKEEIARENALKNALDKGITQKLEKGEDLSVGEILRYYNANDMQKHFTPQSHYKEQQELKKIAQTDFENLDESQKQELQRQNLITRLWNSPKELHDKLKDEVTKKEIDEHTRARAEQLERDIINIQRTYENILKSGADYLRGSTEQSDKYREMLQESAISLGFDGIGFKGDRIYAFKGDNAIFIDDGFFKNLGQILGTNAFDIAGSITGAIAGAKRGTGRIGKLAGGIAGGAVGAGLGGIADSIIAQYNSRGEFNLADALLTGAESATFDIAGGLIVSGGAKAAKGAVKYPLKAAEFVVDRIPILSSVKNAAKNNNFQAVDNMINKNIGQEAREEISENLQEFGGQIHSENVAKYNAIKKTILEKYPDKAEGINKFFGYFETFAQESLKDKQNELLHLYRADRDGSLTAYLVEVANSSPKLQKNLRAMLNITTSKIAAMVEDLNLSPRTNKEIFDALESNVKAEYAEVMERILPEIYDDSYKVTINRMPFDKEIQRMLNDRLLQENDKLIVKSLADEIFQPNQTFKQLVNIKHRLNDQYKQISEGSRGYVEKSVDKLLREAIDSGVNAILGQNKTAFIKARDLYDTMNLEYGRMKEVIGIVDTLKLRDKATSFEKGFNKLYKYLNGQGEADISNLQRLTRYMSETDKEVFESALLKKMFDKAIYEKEKQGIKVFDSTLFLSRIKELSENGAVFESKGAKEFIDIVDKFHALFRQDAEIAKSLSNPKSKNGTGNGIATTLSGRIQQAMVNSLFSVFFRNIPESSLMAQMLTLGKGKDFIGGMALRYHTQKALERAISVDDFMTKFTHSIQHTQWSSASKKKIDDFLTSLREIQTLSEAEIKTQNQAQSMSDYTSENALEQLNALSQANTIKEFGENYPQFYHKGSEAIEHLLQTKSGQVQGAFYRKDLENLSGNGDITLVWGKITDAQAHKGYGLAHILDKHPELDLSFIPQIVEQGKLVDLKNGKIRIITDAYTIGMKKEWKGKPTNAYILTAFENTKESAKNLHSSTLTKGETLPLNSNAIISQSEPFASTKANFTKEQWQNLTAQEKIQILKDRRRQELQRAIQEKMAKEAQESQILKEAQQEKQRIRDAQVGKAINEVGLNLQGAIQARALKPTRINLENKSYPAQFVIINKEDLKPNFETKGTQGRTQKQENVIQDIQNNLNPNKLFFSEGGFEGLPIILKDGQVSVGNHRAQALKNLSQESLASYQKSAKEVFGVDLKDEELIVRMLDERIPNDEILNLSFASNVGREQNLSEKALSTLGKYQENLDKLPQNISAQNVEEMQQIVAKSLDKTNNGLNTFDTNFALFASLAKSKNKNILDALKAISGDAEQKAKVVKMFAENAGNFHNLAKQTQMPNLDLRDYLTQALYFTAKANDSRVENFKELAQEIKSIIQTTDAQGKSALIQEESYYNGLIGKALGYSFARFRELENPSGSFFDFLSNIRLALREELEPTLFSAGRPLSSADIYDFLSVSIKSGIPSNETSEVLELLPQLKAKHEAIKETNAKALSKNISAKADSLQEESAHNALKILENTQGAKIPKELDINAFMKSLENVENKENFIKHLQSKTDAQSRLAYLNLVEPTLKEFDLKLTKGERESYIKIFNDGNNFYSLLITQEQDKQLITFLPKARMDYIKRKIESADLIQTFTDRASNNAIGLANNIIPQNIDVDFIKKESDIKKRADSLQTQGITEEIKQLIDTGAQKGRDMQIIGQENFTPEVVEYVQQQNKKVAIEKLSQEEAEALGFKYPQDVRVTIDYSAINHTLNRHGAQSNLSKKSGQEAVEYSDIAKYREYAKNADETLESVDNGGSNVLISYKQVNGHFVAVEQIKRKNNELGFKTLFKGTGNYKDSKSYKDTKAKAQTLSIGYEPSANSFALAKSLNSNAIIPQSTKEAIDPANRFAQPFSNEQFSALPKAKQAQYQSLQKQAGVLYNKYHQAKGIEAKRAYEKQYNAMLDKIYNFEQKYPVRVSSTQMQVRGNTMPTYKPDEIIDVEIIQAEPSIQKQIAYKRHNARVNLIAKLQNHLSTLKQDSAAFKAKEQKLLELKRKNEAEADEFKLINPTREDRVSKIKINKDLQNVKIQDLEILSQEEFNRFVENVLSKNYAKAENYVRLENINDKLIESLGLPKGEVYLSKKHLSHFRPTRKEAYQQALSAEEIKRIPQVIREAQEAFLDTNKRNFFLTFNDEANGGKINVLHFNADELGNYVLTAKKVNSAELNKKEYHKVVAEGLAPTIPHEAKTSAPSTTLTASTTKGDIIPQSISKEEFQEEVIRAYERIKDEFKGHPSADYITLEIQKAYEEKVLKQREAILKEIKKAFVENGLDKQELEYLDKRLSYTCPESLSDEIRQIISIFERNIEAYTSQSQEIIKNLVKNKDKIAQIPLTPKRIKAYEDYENIARFHDKTCILGSKEAKAVYAILEQAQKAQSQNTQPLKFKDSKGLEHTISQEIQEQWLRTFNLKSIEDSYIPNQSKEIKEALGGKEIKLQLGSLKKLVAQGREEFIPQIKQVLDEPEAILKDSDNAFLFAKHLKDEDYFVNVSVDKGEYLVSISNGIKETNNIQNKLLNGAEVIYQSPNANSNLQTLLQASRYSTNKTDNAIIPQSNITGKEALENIYKELQKQYKDNNNKRNMFANLDKGYNRELSKKLESKIIGFDVFKKNLEKVQSDFNVEIMKYATTKEDRIKTFANYMQDAQNIRADIEEALNLHPLEEFGTNYAEYYHDGQGALRKILAEAEDYEARKAAGELTESEAKQGAYKGQVSGAFYRKDLEDLSGNGNIDLVWGDSNFGLKHILDKHEGEFQDFAKELSEIVENGKLEKDDKGRLRIENEKYIVGIKDNWKGQKGNNWIVTAYEKKEGGGSLYTSPHNHTSEIPLETSSDIIPQSTKEILQEARAQGLSGKETLAKIKEAKAQSAKITESQLENKIDNAVEKLNKISGFLNIKLNNYATELNRKTRTKTLSKEQEAEIVSFPYEIAKIYHGWNKGYYDKVEKNLKKVKNNFKKALKKGEKIDIQKLGMGLFDEFSGESETFLISLGFNVHNKKIRKDVLKIIEEAIKQEKEILKDFAESLKDFASAALNSSKKSGNVESQINLKDELENATIIEKKDIVLRELNKQLEPIKTKIKELDELIKTQDFTSFEIQDALNFITEHKKTTHGSIRSTKQGKVLVDVDFDYIPMKLIDSKNQYTISFSPDLNEIERAKHFLTEKTRIEEKNVRKSLVALSKRISDFELYSDVALNGFNEKTKARFRSWVKQDLIKEKFDTLLEKEIKAALKIDKEAREAVSLTYDLSTKEGLEKTKKLFDSAETTEEQKELFNYILPFAQKLGVRVRHSIRDPYEFFSKDTKKMAGIYNLNDNTARVKHNGNIEKKQKPKTLLHELIHSVTSRAMYAYERGQKDILTQRQIKAIENINDIYKQVLEKRDELGLKSYKNSSGDYGLKDAHEIIAELSNPQFTEKLKKINVFERLIDNIIKLFVDITEAIGLKKTNAYERLKNEVKEIVENYNDSFTSDFNKVYQNMRGITLEQQNIKKSNFDSLKDITFKDKNGKEKILRTKTQEQWLRTFNLKSIEDSYIPNQSKEIKEALGGKEIKLQLGSLKKLVAQGREEFIPQIKQVLDEPEAIIKDNAGDFLLVKHLKDKDFFVNVSFDNGEFLISISNGIKEANNIKNKLKNNAEVIYQSPNANSILQTLLQASRYSTNKIDSAIIPQSTKEILQEARAQGTNLESNAYLGVGLASGSVAGFENNGEGLELNAQDFTTALILGAYGGKVSASMIKKIANSPRAMETIQRISKYKERIKNGKSNLGDNGNIPQTTLKASLESKKAQRRAELERKIKGGF